VARSKVMGRFGTGAQATWGVALAFLLFSAAMPSSHAQIPLKAREALQKGNDAYRAQHFEQAAIFYGQAEANKKDLSPREVTDLQAMIKQNNLSLQQRRDGKLFLAKAQELVKDSKYDKATLLLDQVITNPNMPLPDRQAAEKLKQKIQQSTTPTMPNGPRSYQDMLRMGREALKRGDFGQARMWAQQAQKERPRFLFRPHWLGGDNPDRLQHEIQVAEQNAMHGVNPMSTNPKGSTSPFGFKWFRGRDNAPMPPEIKGHNGPMNVPSEGPILNPPSGGPNSSSIAAPMDHTALRSDPDASGIQRVSASFPQVEPNMSRAECNAKARELINQGYEALRGKDYDTARKCAYQAKELRPDLEYWQANPDKLLAEIQRVAPATDGSPEVVQTAARSVPEQQAAKPGKANARELLKQARTLFKEKKLEDADKLCAQAAGVPGTHWGLFEDSPEKLRGEIQKVRSRRDREESVRLLAEARKQFSLGRAQEAKTLAWRAQQLHGPYSIWDLSDRPQKLLAEIERAEGNTGNPNNPSKTGSPKSASNRPDDKTQSGVPTQAQMAASNGQRPSGDLALRGRAMTLLTEARELQKKGMLIEARQRAFAAQQLNAHFTADEDSPVNALRDLAGLCDRQVEALLHRAGESVGAANDPARFEKANADLIAARNIAAAFGQDLTRVDQRAAWVQQVQASAGVGPPPALPGAAPQAPIDPNQQLGRDKLAKALDELRAGNTHTARRLAEEAFDAKYGMQKEAVAMLNSIDAEEHNQSILAAHNNALAALEAYKRKDYRIAQNILSRVDPRLLNPQMQNVVRELSASREMQPSDLQVAAAQEPSKASNSGNNGPGHSSVGDLPPKGPAVQGDDLMEKYKGMEDIVFQKLRAQSLEAMRRAFDLLGSGQNDQAIQLLQDCRDQLGSAQLDAERVSILKKQLEQKIQQYRMLQAQKTINSENIIQQTGHNEGLYQMKLLKTQEEVADLMKQYRVLMKEGKIKEAATCARKAMELDPENTAAQAGCYIASVKLKDEEWKKNKGRNEDMFQRELGNDYGNFVTPNDPLAFDQSRLERARKRQPPNYPAQMHNPVERAIEQKLALPIASLNFKDTPLKQVITDLQMLTGLNIVPDVAALQQSSVSLEMPMSLMVENISLKSALNLLLKQANLTYVVKNEVLNITTENNSKGHVKQVVYGVADLVVPVDDNPLPETNSLSAALERQIAAASASTQMGVMPGPYSLPGGQNVSAMGAQPGSGAITPGGANVQKSHTRTIEDLLINLIQSTVAPDTWSSVGGPGVIQYFPLGMALIVNQTQDVQEQVQDLLAALRKLQDLEVAIEMRLVSVSESFFERIGVDFDMNFLTHNSQAVQNQLLNGQFQPQGVINRFTPSRFVSGLTPAGVFTPDLNIPINSTSFGMSLPPFGGYPGTMNGDGGLALGLAFLSDIQVFMFMEAAQGDRRTNVMQAPKITVFNGQTAFITVQDQQFFLIGVQFVPTPFGNIIFNPQQTPFPLGVQLQVTPVVSADRRFVRMNLTPQMTNLASATVPLIPVQLPIPTTVLGPGTGTTSGPPEAIFQMFFQQPTFTQIFLSTTVNVPDGGTVLLGGLKTLSESRNEFGPPVLSKIPYISRLFKNVGYGKEAQSLMIMVTPRIIINEEEEQIYIGALPPIPRF